MRQQSHEVTIHAVAKAIAKTGEYASDSGLIVWYNLGGNYTIADRTRLPLEVCATLDEAVTVLTLTR